MDVTNAGRGVLVVDDDEQIRELVRRVLTRAGVGPVESRAEADGAVDSVLAGDFDLLVLDMHLRGSEGIDVIYELRSRDSRVPVLCLTGDATWEVRLRALDAGATDFVLKPIQADELVLRTRNLLEMGRLQRALSETNVMLERRVSARTAELERSRAETLRRLALAAEFRDDDTYAHTDRVGVNSARLAAELGWSAEDIAVLREAAPLHDVGKIGIPDSILLKPARLTEQEFDIVKQHTEIGASILSHSEAVVLRMAEVIARTHHERWDGSGYMGLRGAEIPEVSRLVAVVDIFDALTHERPYKHAWTKQDARAEIEAQRGRLLDPEPTEVFLDLLDRDAILI